MSKRARLSFIGLCLLLLSGSFSHAQHVDDLSNPFVVTGVIVNSDNANLIERFVAYLARQSGYPLRLVYVNSYTDLSIALRANPNAIAWTCGVPYVQDHKSGGQQLVAVPLFNGEPTYHSLILTSSGRTEKTLVDFKGAVLAYSDPRSNSGFISPNIPCIKKVLVSSNIFAYYCMPEIMKAVLMRC